MRKATIRSLILGAIAIAMVVQFRRGAVALFANGIKLNNPGFIVADPAVTLAGEKKPSSHPRFAEFTDQVWGLYALAKRLATIMAGPGDRTLNRVISGWALERDANPGGYVEAIAQRSGLQPGTNIEGSMPSIMKAIIEYENGEQPYVDLLIVNAWRMTQLNAW